MLLDEYIQLIEVPQYKRPYIYILLLPRSRSEGHFKQLSTQNACKISNGFKIINAVLFNTARHISC